ncbi:hypothetical protein [Halarcobacter ebronensis]|uniref:Uncharacterized protein n=1 Tax=Halarcobacter ebronensis TaxID=1462615 RepID=A0A4Q1ANZ9_9BACT|nr:hypothetical protein [Halarcobacter ebronensis]QKF82366.1 hypothetical protein AEBR_1886 [Halarcobacter ebronensis]RXK07607.1 hypothetical protein CRV07_03860 [Halarcobacter ebronensis]
MTMYKYIEQTKLKKELDERNPFLVVNEWADNAMELESKKMINEIRELFNSFTLQEINTFRIESHLNMIFEELSEKNISRFLSSQVHLKKNS